MSYTTKFKMGEQVMIIACSAGYIALPDFSFRGVVVEHIHNKVSVKYMNDNGQYETLCFYDHEIIPDKLYKTEIYQALLEANLDEEV